MSVAAVASTGSPATGDGESDTSSTGGGQPAPAPSASGDQRMVGSFTTASAADANGADGSASASEQADATGTGRQGEPTVGTRNGELLRTPGLDRMSIDLSDEGLGPLTLQAANGAGGLQLRLTAGDRAVGEALAASAHELRSELEASGTALGSLDVGHRDTPGHRHGPNDHRLASGRADRLVAPASPTATATRAISATRPVGSGSTGLDLRI
jgi:flagellar hook-length control protein FliK